MTCATTRQLVVFRVTRPLASMVVALVAVVALHQTRVLALVLVLELVLRTVLVPTWWMSQSLVTA